jgi:hypothetical protein
MLQLDPYSTKIVADHLHRALIRDADAERLAAQLDHPSPQRTAWVRLAAAGVQRLAQALAAGRSAPARSS